MAITVGLVCRRWRAVLDKHLPALGIVGTLRNAIAFADGTTVALNALGQVLVIKDTRVIAWTVIAGAASLVPIKDGRADEFLFLLLRRGSVSLMRRLTQVCSWKLKNKTVTAMSAFEYSEVHKTVTFCCTLENAGNFFATCSCPVPGAAKRSDFEMTTKPLVPCKYIELPKVPSVFMNRPIMEPGPVVWDVGCSHIIAISPEGRRVMHLPSCPKFVFSIPSKKMVVANCEDVIVVLNVAAAQPVARTVPVPGVKVVRLRSSRVALGFRSDGSASIVLISLEHDHAPVELNVERPTESEFDGAFEYFPRSDSLLLFGEFLVEDASQVASGAKPLEIIALGARLLGGPTLTLRFRSENCVVLVGRVMVIFFEDGAGKVFFAMIRDMNMYYGKVTGLGKTVVLFLNHGKFLFECPQVALHEKPQSTARNVADLRENSNDNIDNNVNNNNNNNNNEEDSSGTLSRLLAAAQRVAIATKALIGDGDALRPRQCEFEQFARRVEPLNNTDPWRGIQDVLVLSEEYVMTCVRSDVNLLHLPTMQERTLPLKRLRSAFLCGEKIVIRDGQISCIDLETFDESAGQLMSSRIVTRRSGSQECFALTNDLICASFAGYAMIFSLTDPNHEIKIPYTRF